MVNDEVNVKKYHFESRGSRHYESAHAMTFRMIAERGDICTLCGETGPTRD